MLPTPYDTYHNPRHSRFLPESLLRKYRKLACKRIWIHFQDITSHSYRVEKDFYSSVHFLYFRMSSRAGKNRLYQASVSGFKSHCEREFTSVVDTLSTQWVKGHNTCRLGAHPLGWGRHLHISFFLALSPFVSGRVVTALREQATSPYWLGISKNIHMYMYIHILSGYLLYSLWVLR